MNPPPFLAPTSLSESFLSQGFVTLDIKGKSFDHFFFYVMDHLCVCPEGMSVNQWLNNTHDYISVENLNDVRLRIHASLNSSSLFRQLYFKLAEHALYEIVGNELAMQKRINLSIQFPGDGSSLLPVHTDVWSGDSPYEVVLWVPLVNCYRTKSMYIVPLEVDRAIQPELAKFRTTEELFKEIEPHIVFLDVKFGQAVLFSQNLMHGNVINQETTTRWSLNCRFKSLLSPYADKKLGEFFEPINIRPATRLGMDYKFPQGFRE